MTDRLRWTLVAAPPTPIRPDGSLDLDVCAGYFRHLVQTGAGGLAISVPNSRLQPLPAQVTAELVQRAVATNVPVVVYVGHRSRHGQAWMEMVAAAGAEALVVFPPDGDHIDAVTHHDVCWKTSGLPLIVCDPAEHPYPLDVLNQVLDHPGVVGYTPARLSDAIACQAGIAAARARGRLVLSGEDRMLGPSLMWGAEGALLGLGAAAAQVPAAVVAAFAAAVHMPARDAAARFLEVAAIADELARVIVRPPFDGSAQRLLWIAAHEGAIPAEFAVDPHRPSSLDDAERDEIMRVARQCRDQVRQ